MFKGKGGPLIVKGSFHKKDEAASGLRRSLTKEAKTSY